MKLFKGEISDTLPINQPDNSWREARNLMFFKDALKNEDGFEGLSLYYPFIPIGELFLPDGSLLTFLVDEGNSNRILRETSTGQVVVTNFDFGLSVRYPVRAKAKYTSNLDIEVVFTDNNTPPRHITIDSLTGALKENNLEETKLFPNISIPNFTLKSVGSGGVLEKGSYYLSISYNFGDDDYTNWVGMSNQIVLPSSGMSFTVEITDLDETFDAFKVDFIKVTDDAVVSAQETLIDFQITGTTRILTITGSGRSIEPNAIITKSISYDKIGDLAVINGRLYAASLYRDAVLDYQSYANNIRIEPIYDDYVSLDAESGSYADSLIIFDKVGFQDDEIYAFYITLHLTDGTSGGDFFIPCNNWNGMLSHTNVNENYPANKDYPAGNVKHHKFPKKAALDYLSQAIIPGATRAGTGAASGALDGNGSTGMTFSSLTGTLGTMGNDATYPSDILNNTITFSTSYDLILTFSYNMAANTTVVGGELVDLYFIVYHNNAEIYSDALGLGGEGVDMNENMIGSNISINVSVAQGDTIRFYGVALITNGSGSNASINSGSFSVSAKDTTPSTDAQWFTKPTGIKVTNIVIPADIASRIQGYEIKYATRNNSNSKVLGQSAIYRADNWGSYINPSVKCRFHAFELLLDKPKIFPNKLLGQYTIVETEDTTYAGSKYDLLGGAVASSVVDVGVNKAKYIPANNVAADNEDGEEYLSFYTDQVINASNRLIANLAIEREDYYLGFEVQVLQSTGKVFKISGPGTYSIDKLYGGDTYTCLYDVRLTKHRESGDTDTQIRNTKIPVSSKYNIALREWGNEWYEQPELVAPPTSIQNTLDLGITTPDAWDYSDYTKRYSNYLKYNKAFSFGNIFIQGEIQGSDLENYPFRIIRTPEQNLESNTSSWRTFLLDDYYEQNKDRGPINNIDVIDTDKLLIHHTNGLFITNAKERLALSATEVVIGTGDIFEMRPKEVIYTSKGALGSVHKFANFVCELGYVFISDGRIYALSSGLENIIKGNSIFLYDNLATGDNPYLQDKNNVYYTGGISMAYDNKYSRLLLSVNRLSDSYSKTYSLELQSWVGSHDWVDGKLFNTSTKLYSFNNSRLYLHNKQGTKCKYYNDTIYDSIIEISANREAEIDKIFENINWKLTGLSGGRNFKTIKVTSDLDDTGEITIVPFNNDIYDDTVNTRKKHSTWFFNRLLVNVGELGNDNLVTGLYAKIRLSLDNTPQDEVAIIDIDYDYQKVDVI